MKIRDLFVSIGFDVKDEDLRALDKGLANTKRLALAVGAGVVALNGLLIGMAKQVADVGDKAAKTADKLGVGIEALQEMRYAAELAGIAQSNFDTGLQRLTRRAAEAAAGTGVAKDALKELGVQVRDANGRIRQSDELLEAIADGMAKIEDPSKRVAIAFKLFDTEGVGMVNMLKNGGEALRKMRAEARSLGFIITEEDARNSEKFNDEMTRAKLVLQGLRNVIGARMLPVLTRLMEQFRMWVVLNRQMIKDRIHKALNILFSVMKRLHSIGKAIVTVVGDLVVMFGGMEKAIMAVVWAMGLLTGAFVISSVGYLTAGVLQLVTAFKVLKVAALAANASALLIPLLIGAAVAALILIIQDLYTYFTGGKSLTGVLVEAFEKKFPRSFKVAAFYLGYFKDLISVLNAFLSATIDYILGLITLDWDRMTRATEKMLRAFDPLIQRWKNIISTAVDFIMKKIQPLIDALDVVRGWASAAGKMIGDKAAGAWKAAQQILTISPESAPANSVSNVNTRQNISVNAPITVTVPEGTAAQDVGTSVTKGISDSFSRMLNDTQTYLEPQSGF